MATKEGVLTAEDLSTAIKRAALPDQVAVFLKRMIMTGKWRPGDRIVETRVAKQLGVGQPTVREALGRLEAVGLVVRSPNSGCVVTKLNEKEFVDLYRVRIELESLAVELAAESDDNAKKRTLEQALAKLRKAAEKGGEEEFYRRDLEFHQAVWDLANNRFLQQALSQMIIPLFSFVTIETLGRGYLDMQANVREHEKMVRAIVASDKTRARKIAREVLEGFGKEGIALLFSTSLEPLPEIKTRK